MALARCVCGHEWEVPAASADRALPERLLCPVCGEEYMKTLVKQPVASDRRTADNAPAADTPMRLPLGESAFTGGPDVDPDATHRSGSLLGPTRPDLRQQTPPSPLPDVPGYEILEMCG